VRFDVFQFQCGTIKSFSGSALPLMSTYFNSSVVRLKGHRDHRGRYEVLYFNSSVVRLKEAGNLTAVQQYQNFNSSVVRLKDFSSISWKILKRISIPVWYD